MNATKNPLAVMADAILLMQVSGYALSANDTREARAAVAELVEAAEKLARRADNNIRSCGEIDMDGPELPALRAALAKFGEG